MMLPTVSKMVTRQAAFRSRRHLELMVGLDRAYIARCGAMLGRSTMWSSCHSTRTNDIDLPSLSYSTLDGLDDRLKPSLANLKRLTDIQSLTWEPALAGQDISARSRTGTGKTLAFLVPSIQRLLAEPSVQDGVRLLVIAPTRELAQQIYLQARQLTSEIRYQVMFGGVPKGQDVTLLTERTPSVLISTPGRLLDHLSSTYIEARPFSDLVKSTSILVLDEMDRLLDQGFQDDVREIMAYLPADRQTLLFSATAPPQVHKMVEQCLRPDHVVVDCVDEADPTTQTNAQTNQSVVILDQSRMVSGAVQLLLHLMKQSHHKILVFFPTTSQVAFFAGLFNRGLGRPVLEIHSKISQHARSATSERFRRARQAVMMTSDVSARGIDYPDVTHVVQFGMASDREAYIHRLGRTGRAGKKGEGILVLMEMEKAYLDRELAGLKIGTSPRLQRLLDKPVPGPIQGELMRISHDMRNGQAEDLKSDAESVYRSLLGYYHSRLRSLGLTSTDALVDLVNDFASQAGLVELPTISGKLARQCGLWGHRRVQVQPRWTVGNLFDVGQTSRPRKADLNEAGDLWD